jgi:hypothetical protein
MLVTDCSPECLHIPSCLTYEKKKLKGIHPQRNLGGEPGETPVPPPVP